MDAFDASPLCPAPTELQVQSMVYTASAQSRRARRAPSAPSPAVHDRVGYSTREMSRMTPPPYCAPYRVTASVPLK